jgi:hypothetical protein
VADAIERMVREGFFKGAEFGRIADRGERAAVAALAREHSLALTQWTADVLFYVGDAVGDAGSDHRGDAGSDHDKRLTVSQLHAWTRCGTGLGRGFQWAKLRAGAPRAPRESELDCTCRRCWRQRLLDQAGRKGIVGREKS